jgi:type IV secretory pathway VirB10-like protein
MKAFTMLAMISLALLGCSKAKDAAGNQPAPQGATEAAPSAPAAAPQPSAPPAGEPEAAAPAGEPLSHYLGAAVAATVYQVKLGSGAEKTKLKTLDEAATKAYLASLDLSQRANGPLAKCPSDLVVELADAAGTALGTIGFCQGKAASFSGPDGTRGGITASAP